MTARRKTVASTAVKAVGAAAVVVVLHIDALEALVDERRARAESGLDDGAGDGRGGQAGARENRGGGHAHVGADQFCATQSHIAVGTTTPDFLAAVALNPRASLVTAVIDGVRIEKVKDRLAATISRPATPEPSHVRTVVGKSLRDGRSRIRQRIAARTQPLPSVHVGR